MPDTLPISLGSNPTVSYTTTPRLKIPGDFQIAGELQIENEMRDRQNGAINCRWTHGGNESEMDSGSVECRRLVS